MQNKERTARLARVAELRANGQRIKDELARLETITEREEAAPYVGKCFKYRNRDSDGKTWWLYIRVLDHDHGHSVRTLQCQSQPGGWHIVTTDDIIYLLPDPKSRGYLPITRRQFDAAWRRFTDRIAAINGGPV